MKLSNIISRYEYQHLKEEECYDYLLKNKIYIRPKLFTKELESKIFEDNYPVKIESKWWLNEHYDINPLIIEDIILQFFKIDFNISEIKNKIDLELEYSLNKEETLKKYYDENINIIHKHDVGLSTFYQKNRINNKILKKIITNHFDLPDCQCINIKIIESYIIKDLPFNLYSIDIYKRLIETIFSLKIIKHLKNRQQGDGKTLKPKEIKIYTFKNYFNKPVLNKRSIEQLQLDYKDKKGKPLALLIYILNDLKIATIKTTQRLQFIRSLKNEAIKNVSDVNRYFNNNNKMFSAKDEDYKTVISYIKSNFIL